MTTTEKNDVNLVAYASYAGGLTLLSLGFLILLSLGFLGDPSPIPEGSELMGMGIILGLGMIARAMSLNALGVQVSIDSVILTTAAFHIPVDLLGWIVIMGTTGFDLCKIAAEREIHDDDTDAAPWWQPSLRSAFSGSISAVILILCVLGFGIQPGENVGFSQLLWKVPAFVACFLAGQYCTVGLSFWLKDRQFGALFRRIALPSFLTEFSLVPVTMLMVLLFDPAMPGTFLILSAICLSFIFVLRRVAVTSSKLLARIRELEIVNSFGQMMSSTLDADFLADRIADGILSVYPSASQVVIARPDDGGQHLECLVYDGDGNRVVEPDMRSCGPIAQWVMDTGQPVRGNMGSGGQNSRGWVGKPIISMGEVVGALLCMTSRSESRSDEAFRLLELVTRQAAVALHNSSLYEQATVDGLTKLFVRRYFDQRLDEEFHRAKRYSSDFSVVLIDVDDFKQVNDTFLHETGDKALQLVAAVIRNCIRAMDVPCRLGGDEFAIVLPEASEDAARIVAERICEGVQNISLTRKARAVNVSVSLGVAGFSGGGLENSAALMQRGDIALYKAKERQGSGGVVVYGDLAESGATSPSIASLRTEKDKV